MAAYAKIRALVVGIVVAFAVVLAPSMSPAQTTVVIGNGQILPIPNILNGSYLGTNFVLGPTTTFKINAGGRIGIISSVTPYGTLDFNGSTIDVNQGGIFGLCINPNCGVVKNLNLNVYGGGSAFSNFQAGAGATANLLGGTIGNAILEAGSVVNIQSGNVDQSLLRAQAGSKLTISGGRFRSLDAQPGSDVSLVGGDFRLNGVAYSDPVVTLASDDLLTGVLSNGNVFILSPSSNLSYSNIKLVAAPLPNPTPGNFVIDGTEAFVPTYVRNGQSLQLRAGGDLGFMFHARRASVEIQGGIVGQQMRVTDSAVSVSGGDIGNRFEAYWGTKMDVTGGTFHGDTWARAGSEWIVRGGLFQYGFTAWEQSHVDIWGGRFEGLMTLDGSTLNVHGGEIDGILAYGGTINLFVKSALVNGAVLNLDFGVPTEILERGFNSNLDVTLADGSQLSIYLAPDQGKPPSPFVHPNANLIVILVPEPSSLSLAMLVLAIVSHHRRRSLGPVA